jgi:hypothetical protein
MNSTLKTLLFWIGLFVIGALIWQFSANFQKGEKLVSFTDLMDLVDSEKISEVMISGNELTAKPTVPDRDHYRLPDVRRTIPISTGIFAPGRFR